MPGDTQTGPATVTRKRTKSSPRILVVDDNVQIHNDFSKVLTKSNHDEQLDRLDSLVLKLDSDFEQIDTASTALMPQFQLDFALQGEEGYQKVCESVRGNDPFSIAFIDVRMPPGWDGIETASKILATDSRIQVVICTAYSDYSINEILNELGLSDRVVILRKPFDVVELQSLAVSLTQKWNRNQEHARIGKTKSDVLQRASTLLDEKHKENVSLLRERESQEEDTAKLKSELARTTSQIEAAKDALLVAISTVAESRVVDMGDQLKRIRLTAQIIAEQLASSSPYQDQLDDEFLKDFHRSTPFYDIGKIGIPDGILLKESSLNSVEKEIMRQHTVIGEQIVKRMSQCSPFDNLMKMAAEITRSHHEAWDGTGYPDLLAGEKIPLSARIVAVADAFDAMTSHRTYRNAMSDYEARCRIEQDSASKFDPEVVKAFGAVFTEICDAKRQFLQQSAAEDANQPSAGKPQDAS